MSTQNYWPVEEQNGGKKLQLEDSREFLYPRSDWEQSSHNRRSINAACRRKGGGKLSAAVQQWLSRAGPPGEPPRHLDPWLGSRLAVIRLLKRSNAGQ